MYQRQFVKIIGVGGGRAGRAPRPIIRAGKAPKRFKISEQIIAKAKNTDEQPEI